MRVTITKTPGVYSQYGILMPLGSINTVGDDFGKSLVGSGQATDTDGVLNVALNRPFMNSPPQLPGTYTFANLPAATGFPVNTQAYTSDSGSVTSNGSVWVKQTGLTVLQTQRANNIAAFALGPQIIAPLWVTLTAYVVGNVVTITGGQHLICSVSGTSGAGMPAYTSAILTGRPFTDGTVTWYGLPWIKGASDANAPTITSGVNAAAVGLTETLFVISTVLNPALTPFSALQTNNASANVAHFTNAAGPSAGSGNATAAGTNAGYSAAYVYNTVQWDMEFYVTDAKFGITCHNTSTIVYIEIDGQMVQGNPLISSGTPGWCIAFDYGGVVKRRLVRISDTGTGAAIRGFALSTIGYIDPSDTLNDQLLVIGDSLFQTTVPSLNAMAGHQGHWLKRLLGFSGLVNSTIGGSGYVSENANTFNLPHLLANPANQAILPLYNPSHVLIAAGFNDRGTSFGLVGPAALGVWQTVRAMFPLAKITVLDGYPEASGPDANALTQAANLLALFNTWNDPYSRFIQPVGAATTTAWTRGTGNAGIALSAGNASNFVGTDGTHPTPAGHFYLASRMAAAFRTVWNNQY